MSITYTIQIFDQKIEVRNKVAIALIRQYEERFPDDKPYVMGKALELTDMDTEACLLKWFALDGEGRRVFGRHLGMPMGLLENTCEGIKWIVNH